MSAGLTALVVDNFTLTISGINGSSDAVGGRYGVFAFAFNAPTEFVSATALSPGFELVSGGLSSGSGGGGCDGSGNFICFRTTQSIVQKALAANSTLSFDFQVDASGISIWGPANSKNDFKIGWDGSKSKNYHYNPQDPGNAGDFKSGYDHVSADLAVTPAKAPEIDPAGATAAPTLLAGGLATPRGRRRKS